LRSHAAQHEAFDGFAVATLDAAAAGWGYRFVEDIVRLGRQNQIAVTLGSLGRTGREESRDVGHEHRKGTQQRIDPVIERRRGYQPSVLAFVLSHAGILNPPGGGAEK
jgi:hypothetical protein